MDDTCDDNMGLYMLQKGVLVWYFPWFIGEMAYYGHYGSRTPAPLSGKLPTPLNVLL